MELVRLPDGSEVVVRRVRASDKPLFAAAFEHFGEASRYKRFMAVKPRLTGADLEFLTELDHADHEALGALEPASGAGLGVARYVRHAERPDAAEAAVAVIDAWQGRGLGGALLHRLCLRATENGIGTFTATLLASNRSMLHLFERLGSVRLRGREGAAIEIDVELAVGGEPQLRTVLRSAATGHVGSAR